MDALSSPEAGDRQRALEALILEAFAQAQDSGKADWERMSIAVLKNRILKITDQRFSQQDYGHHRFIDLVKSLPDVVSVDQSSAPATVVLVKKPPPLPERERLRKDLWQAIMDYSSGNQYVWDPSGEARPRVPDDPNEFPALPTITGDELATWRREFVDEVLKNPANSAVEGRVREWAQRGLSTGFLPPHLRGQWNHRLREAAVARVRDWFRLNAIVEPVDLVIRSTHAPVPQSSESVESLRTFVMRAIEHMTAAELSELQLPATAALRVHHKRG